jgi:hypothetical protein
MTWDAYNRRKEVLREVLDVADRQRGSITATELLNTIDGGREAYATDTDLLLDLQMAWFQRLSGRMDQLLAESVDGPETMAVQAWVDVAGQMPGARRLLDAHLTHPAFAKAFAKEHELLAASAGVPLNHPHLADRGQRILDSAREAVVHPDPVEVDSRDPRGFIARLRDAMAA